MVKDAESHADEDRRQRELVEARNNAENAAYQAEKQLEELGDSVDESSKEGIKKAIEDVRGSLESEDTGEINAKTEALQTAFHAVSEQMYAAAAAQQQEDAAASGNGADADGSGDEEEVVDAEVVDDASDEKRSGRQYDQYVRRSPKRSRRCPEEEPEAAEREREEYLALAQRTQADLENYRKRAAKEIAAAGERAKSGLVGELLPVVDNLERALESAQEGEEHLPRACKLVHSELVAVLVAQRRRAVRPEGREVRPRPTTRRSRPARTRRPTPGVVLDVVEKGYRLNGTVLRPARVVVSG